MAILSASTRRHLDPTASPHAAEVASTQSRQRLGIGHDLKSSTRRLALDPFCAWPLSICTTVDISGKDGAESTLSNKRGTNGESQELAYQDLLLAQTLRDPTYP
ncbi:hypothetical protein CF326_g4012 [Tilletia indica]|nr:hypothetical protein CF326_g4012 [Tilletia indica]